MTEVPVVSSAELTGLERDSLRPYWPSPLLPAFRAAGAEPGRRAEPLGVWLPPTGTVWREREAGGKTKTTQPHPSQNEVFQQLLLAPLLGAV